MDLRVFNRKQKQPTPNYLELIPVQLHQHEDAENGRLNVLVPKFPSRFGHKYLMPRLKKPYIKAKLDDFGSATWRLIDGRRDVGEMAEALLAKFGDKIQPVHERLTVFLTRLYRGGLISFTDRKKQ